MFRVFSAVCLCFSRLFPGVGGVKKTLGVLDGFPWFLPKHQGMEDQGKGGHLKGGHLRMGFRTKVRT